MYTTLKSALHNQWFPPFRSQCPAARFPVYGTGSWTLPPTSWDGRWRRRQTGMLHHVTGYSSKYVFLYLLLSNMFEARWVGAYKKDFLLKLWLPSPLCSVHTTSPVFTSQSDPRHSLGIGLGFQEVASTASGRLGFSRFCLSHCILVLVLALLRRISPSSNNLYTPYLSTARMTELSIILVRQSASWAPVGTHLRWIPVLSCSLISFAWSKVLYSEHEGVAFLFTRS